ncbi:MAG: ABC transporter permease, partial [Hyphomicrobiaceae bacterium]
GAVIRWGLGAESLAWLIVFVLLPLVCVYYPLSTLPEWLQPIALMLPPTHVFEGLRALVLEGRFEGVTMALAFGLNIIYLGLGFWVFRHLLEVARTAGSLVQMGE